MEFRAGVEELIKGKIFMSTKKRALIFGATGQDGSYLSELLLQKDYEVYGVSRQVSVSNLGRVGTSLQNPSYQIVTADITDGNSVSRLIKKLRPNEVYNLAAQSSVTISFDEPSHTFDVTAKGCLNILEAIRTESPDSRFFLASSSETYGGNYSVKDCYINENSEHIETRYQNEWTSFNPRSPYAVAKLAAFNLTRIYRDSYNLFTCSGILHNHESIRRGEQFVTRKITRYIGDLLNSDKPIPKLKLGNLSVSRDWGHAKDTVIAMYLMLNTSKPRDYVVATGATHSLKEFLTEAFSYIYRDWRDYVEVDPQLFRVNEVPYCQGDFSLIEKDLGWKPTITFKQLVREMVNADSNLEKRVL